jgi:DNA-directed RNA polymerase specialized sigma24 family protein
MKEKRPIDHGDFERLLDWLDVDRERAGEKYEEIRHTLIKMFTWRGCGDAEDLADEVINRVMQKPRETLEKYEGEPINYFRGFVRNILLEYNREAAKHRLPITSDPQTGFVDEEIELREIESQCLDHCLGELNPGDRALILRYYVNQGSRRIQARVEIARDLRLGVNALRVKMFRIRKALAECLERCLEPARNEMRERETS